MKELWKFLVRLVGKGGEDIIRYFILPFEDTP
jgi:hypothetical protein